MPKVGELIYANTMISIDHGEDVEGGLSLVTRVYPSMSGDAKCLFVEIAQHDRGGNWTQFLFEKQLYLMERHGNNIAHPDPDLR